jgi:hypothetical protein
LELEESVVVVFCFPPITIAGEMLPARELLPAYEAVTECNPAVRGGTVRVAVPPLRTPTPIGASPSWNVTVPMVLPGVTIAVSVTEFPGVAALQSEEIDMVVGDFS